MQLRCKSKKLQKLVASRPKKFESYEIPFINLSAVSIDIEPLEYGPPHSYIDKKHVKRNVAVKLELLSIVFDKYLNLLLREKFHEYLRASTIIITKNIYNNNGNSFKSLNSLRKNKNTVVLPADKKSCTVILNKVDYIKKSKGKIY